MFFVYCIKKVLGKNKEEDFTEVKTEGHRTSSLLSNIYDFFNSIRNKFSFNLSCLFEKITIIRIMIFVAFFLFLFLFIKSIVKEKTTFTKKSYVMTQKKFNKFKFKSLNTKQLINENNIKVKKKLSVSLNVEHSNYVHLQIDSIKGNRWKVPNEILNNEYFNTMDEQYSKKNVNFEIEYIQNKNLFYFNLYTVSLNQKNIFYSFTTRKNFLFSKSYINFESILTSNIIYGFGERIHKFKLKEGLYTIWPTNQKNKYDHGEGGQNLFGHQPIALHKTKFKDIWLGLVFLNSNAQDVQIYKKSLEQTVVSYKTIGGIIDYYIIVNNSPENIIKDIKYLLGMPALPPFWALGFHLGGDMFNDINEFKKVYKTYKEKKIPFDAIWIREKLLNSNKDEENDIHSLYKSFAYYIREKIHSRDHNNLIITRDCDISFNEKEYSKYKKIGDEYNIFVKSKFTENNLISQYEKGRAIMPDFLDPEINVLWNEILFDIYNTEANFDGICLENEPIPSKLYSTCQGEVLGKSYSCNIFQNFKLSYIPGLNAHENVLSNGGLSLNALTFNNMIFNNKPLINIYQSKHTFNYIKKLQKRPFVISQSNSFGSGKYSFHWFGNNKSKNAYIKYSISSIFNYNIFGIPFTGADICGFFKKADGNLCTRWFNIGAFYPFMRNNFSPNKNKEKFPWSFGPDVENIIIRDIKMRYSLLRYFYSQLFLVSLNEKGGFFKPVMFEFPDDIYSYHKMENIVMVGEALLICTFFENEEKDKNFTFPNANFNRYPNGENIINYSDNINIKREISLSGKKDELHIFVRGGYIIPMQDTLTKYVMNTFYLRQEKLNIIINPDHMGYSKGTIIFDNDEIDTIEKGKYIRVNLEFRDKILKVIINYNDTKYIFRDDNLEAIEIWRINELFKNDAIYMNKIFVKIKVKDEYRKISADFDNVKNKMKIEFKETISLFDLKEIDIRDCFN